MKKRFELLIAVGMTLAVAGCQPLKSPSLMSPARSMRPMKFSGSAKQDQAKPTGPTSESSRQVTASKPQERSTPENNRAVFRGQDYSNQNFPGTRQDGPNGYPQNPVPKSGVTDNRGAGSGRATQATYQDGLGQPPGGNPMVPPGTTFGNYPYNSPQNYPPNSLPPGQGQLGVGRPWITPPGIQSPYVADLDINVREGQTGQFLIGAGINSDAGVTGQLTISEKNFDILRWPRSFRDITSGEAFRGRGQSFRLEALPGTQVQRYLVSFSEPYFYLMGQPFSFSTSGYYFTRGYLDWDEQRLGGTVSLGYRLTQDVSLSVSARAEDVTIFNPRVATSPDLTGAVGDNELYTVSVGLTHDTRDHPFLSSQGHFLSLSYQQAFGNFDYPRGDLEYRRYWLLTMRPDGSGKHTISHSTKVGVTGSQTPVFENYFAGGFSTMRGFDFRGASPVQGGAITGGEFQFLNSLEYVFPLTPDDMFKGVLFCDYGTVEESVKLSADNFRVVPGFGFRINLPVGGAGGAPLAFDFGFPVASAATDDRRMFSFYMAVLR